MKPLIVVPTHRTGTAFLENLLRSFRGSSAYPILIVVNDHRPGDREIFEPIAQRYASLGLSVEYLVSNSFELGGLLVAMTRTDCDEFLLLSHSCEIVDARILELVFDAHPGKSVGFGSQTGNWNVALGENREFEGFILQHLDRAAHDRLLAIGDIRFWQAHVGKYRRAVLELLDLQQYLPSNMIEAIAKSELLFSYDYQQLEPDSVVLFPNWVDGGEIEEKFGKPRMKIANEYLIKWKSHWNPGMVYSDMMGINKKRLLVLTSRVRRRLRAAMALLGMRSLP